MGPIAPVHWNVASLDRGTMWQLLRQHNLQEDLRPPAAAFTAATRKITSVNQLAGPARLCPSKTLGDFCVIIRLLFGRINLGQNVRTAAS